LVLLVDFAAPLGALEIVRVAAALALFLFLPGWLFVTGWLSKQKKVWRAAEVVFASVFASIVFLSLAASLLAFTVGANLLTVFVFEAVLIAVLWLWRKKN
jgi:uncharacterized membrane protein